ncbi:hypothetical protein BDL97_18G052000, partial [Sphagnum fallax]
LDFVGPLNLIIQCKQYVLVMMEHFKKWLELVPLLNHNNERCCHTFMDRIFNRFRAPTKVLINQGVSLGM